MQIVNAKPRANRILIDIEANHNDPSVAELLEFGFAIVTPDMKQMIARNHFLIRFDSPESLRACYERTTEFVQNMHTNNGLWADLHNACGPSPVCIKKEGCLDEWSLTPMELDATMVKLINHFAPAVQDPEKPERFEKPVAVGNNVQSYDMRIMSLEMPETFKLLHYRSINTSSLREDIAGTYSVEFKDAQATHRVLGDIEYALENRRACLEFLRNQRV